MWDDTLFPLGPPPPDGRWTPADEPRRATPWPLPPPEPAWDHGRRVLTTTGLSSKAIAELARAAQAESIEVRFRIPTPDRRLAAALEPDSPPPSLRFAGLRAARRAGLVAGVLVAPVVPGVNDVECDLARLLHEARRSGASFVEFGIARPSERSGRRLVRSLKERYPRAAARYEVRRYTVHRAASEDRAAIEAMVQRLAAGFGVTLRAPTSEESPHRPGFGRQGRFSFAV